MMTDLRALLYEPWVDAGPDGRDVVRQESLATRLPQCVPKGLKAHESEQTWWIRDPDEGMPLYRRITDAQAELLFIGQAVLVLVGSDVKIGSRIIEHEDGDWTVARWDDSHICTAKSLPAALAAAMHRLADEGEDGRQIVDIIPGATCDE